MKAYKCLYKIRDKNNIIKSYILLDLDTNSKTEVKAQQLKQAMISNKVNITNLKLTIDNKLIDKEEIREQKVKEQKIKDSEINKQKIINSYSKIGNKEQINFVSHKLNSKRVGKLVAKALIIGLATTSVSTSLIGCNYQSNTNSYNIEETKEQNIEENKTLSRKEVIAKLKEIDTIKVEKCSFESFECLGDTTVKVDGYTIGKIIANYKSVNENIKFKSLDNDIIAEGKKNTDFLTTGFNVYGTDKDIKYKIQKSKKFLDDKYIIQDTEKNDIGYIINTSTFKQEKLEIRDLEDNIIAVIAQDRFFSDKYTIEIKDTSKISNEYIILILVNYNFALHSVDDKES